MTTFYFVVPGEPQGKARVRFSGKNGKNYTPDKTVAYEELVRQRFLDTAQGLRFSDDEPVFMKVIINHKIPKSASKKKRQQMLDDEILPIKRPDGDNCLKIIKDALNGIAYRDDCQVVYELAEKHWSENGSVIVIMTDKEGFGHGWVD